ncbi:hypothetical protein GCM10010517_16120 [Streptosporangium fragile]|uniref:Transposase n=1 Tax=Streptosporangium fragile TaxID=46186 RepID=A0ABN3VUY9_9ACTN
MARGDLTDEEWSLIELHLPLGERGPIPDLRQQLNAVMWWFRTGSPALLGTATVWAIPALSSHSRNLLSWP